MTELEQNIQQHYGAKGEEISLISSLFKPEKLKKGEYYLRSGKVCDKLSFIESGFLRLYASVDGKEVTQWIGSKGSFISDMASHTFDIPSRWNIQALSDIQLHTISKKDYNSIVTIVPRWAEIEKHFTVSCFTFMEDRIFAHLSMSAAARYYAFYDQNRELFNQVPLQYIASMLGMTPETFSRIRKKSIS